MSGPQRISVLLVSPTPPASGGISSWTRAVLASELAERFELHAFNTAPRDTDVSGRSRFRLDRAAGSVGMIAGFACALFADRPRVVHVNTSYHWALLRDGLFIWMARAAGARTLLHFRGGDFPAFAGRLPRPVARLLDATLRCSNRLVALTRETEAFLVERVSRHRVSYLPNFVDPAVLALPAGREGRSGPVEILYVGWLIETKGLRELLAAVTRVEGARLTLVGPGDAAFVASLGPALQALGPRVRLLAPRAWHELLPLYAQADLLVLPTWREGFPNVVLEAMGAGLPVVATPVGAIPDVIRHGEEGLLVAPRDEDALAAALHELVADAEKRRAMGARARTRAEALFARERVLGALGALWEGLAAAPRGTA